MIASTDSKPWYKQFWPWFVIALPATAVVTGLYTLLLALQNKPDIVRDDWYKDGLAIEQRKDKNERAEALGISFNYSLDRSSKRMNLVASGLDEAKTPILSLVLQHPTIADRDIDITAALMPDQHYVALFQELPAGLYHLQVSAPEADWQVNGVVQFTNPEVSGTLSARPAK